MSAAFSIDRIHGLSVRDVIDQRAAAKPNRVYLIDPASRQTLTYRDVRLSARAFAARLAAQGVRPGDTVAYAMENGADAARVILGCLYGGYVATAINLVSGSATISYVLEHSEAALLFVDAKTAEIVAEAAQKLTRPPKTVEISPEWFAGDDEAVLEPVSDASDGLLMYTSGTTGKPKGVLLTHRSLLAGGGNAALAHALSDEDRALCVLPVYHINGLCVTVMGPLVSGGSVVMPQKFSVTSFWNHLRDHACTWFSVVPTQISYLLHHSDRGLALPALRFGRSASAPLSPDVQSAFEAKFDVPIIETMGLTETAAQILSNPLPPGIRKIGSPGIAFGNEVLIADPKQQEMARGEEGEVIVRGPNVMRCYRNNDEATAASLTSEGWLRTGDLGRMDDDGYIFITGRLKELIIKGGENIAPREIDDALYSHPDVIEAAAFAKPSENYGQTVEAGVQVRDGAALTESDLLELCRSTVGAFKAPDRIYFLPELPKGPSGKIQRMKLAEMAVDF
jgi:acyl-CoA synthetase (AMP-forming)/AMP-acid ligase II